MANYLNETGLAVLWNKIKSTFALKTDVPTTLKNPNVLKFGTKNYDGSSEQTITAADLGALTSHQSLAGKQDKLVSGTNIKTVNSTSLLGSGNVSVGTYSKPSGGIPKTDLASAVQTSLGKADTALQSHQDISGKANKATTLAGYGITDAYTKAQTDSAITNAFAAADALTYKGTLSAASDASVRTPSASKGDVYKIVGAGGLNGEYGKYTVEVGDMVICNTDNTPAFTAGTDGTALNAKWDVIQSNISIVARVATTGSYNDLTNKPSIPSVGAISDSTINSTCV